MRSSKNLTAILILNFIALATPLFIMLVYDRVIAAGSLGTLPMPALGAAIAICSEWRMRNLRSTGLSWLSGRLDNIVSNKIFSHLIGLSPDLIEKASVAAQVARIKTFESVRDFFSGSVFMSLLEVPFVFISIAAIAIIAGHLVWVPLFMIFGYVGVFLFIRHRIKIAIRIAAKASSARQQFTIETFEKIEGIRGHGLSEKWQEKFRHLSGREMMSHFSFAWHDFRNHGTYIDDYRGCYDSWFWCAYDLGGGDEYGCFSRYDDFGMARPYAFLLTLYNGATFRAA